jgi:ABC-type glycerol-3-phosphate transport system substrate-binding protein
LAVGAVAAVAACSGAIPSVTPTPSGAAGATPAPGATSAPTGQTATIKHWDWWVTQGPTVDGEIKLFQQKYPNLTVEKTTQVTDQYPNLLQLAMKANTSPDVFLIPGTPDLVEQVGQNWLKPLNQWVTGAWQSTFPKSAFAEGSNIFQGKVYTAPFDGPAPWLQLYLNDTLFKAAGLTDSSGKPKAPTTWDEVRSTAKALTKAGNGGAAYGWGFGDKQKFVLPWQLMLCQTSGTPDAQGGFDLRTGTYSWASNPVFGNWIKFFMGMKVDGSILPDAMSIDDETARVQFATGKFGMLVGGVWVQSGWAKTNPDFTGYTVVALPHADAKPTSYFYTTPGGTGFGISNQTKLSDEAWMWFSWLNSKEAATRWVQAGQGLRIFPDANKLEYAKQPPYREYMDVALNGIRVAPSPSLLHPTMDQVKPEKTLPDIQGILEGVYTGQITDAKAALSDLESRENAAQSAAIKDAQARGVQVDPSWWRVGDWNLTENYDQKAQ